MSSRGCPKSLRVGAKQCIIACAAAPAARQDAGASGRASSAWERESENREGAKNAKVLGYLGDLCALAVMYRAGSLPDKKDNGDADERGRARKPSDEHGKTVLFRVFPRSSASNLPLSGSKSCGKISFAGQWLTTGKYTRYQRTPVITGAPLTGVGASTLTAR